MHSNTNSESAAIDRSHEETGVAEPQDQKKAIDAWFTNCSYYRCDNKERRILASLGWSVENELKSKFGIQLQLSKEYYKTPKPLSHSAKLQKAIKENFENSRPAKDVVDPESSRNPINPRDIIFSEDNYNNSTWMAFELDLKMGIYQKSPITVILMENIPLENTISMDALLEKIRGPLLQTLKIELSSEGNQDSAKLMIENVLKNNFNQSINKLIANHQVDEKEDVGGKFYQRKANITAVDDSDTVFSKHRKLSIRNTLENISGLTTSKVVKTFRTTMVRQLVGSFSQESTLPLRRDGKLRTFKKKPLEGVSISVEPEKVEIELSKHYQACSSITSITLKERPESLEQMGRTLAKTKFGQMNTRKVKTLLFAYVATFLEIPLNSKELLDSCNVKYDRALRQTLDRDLKTLLDEISGVTFDEKRHVMATFILELKTLVLEWAQSHIPSLLTPKMSKSATKEKKENINI